MIQTRYTKAGKPRYRVRYETPYGREATKTFARKEDAQAYERWIKDRARVGESLPPSRLQRQRAVKEFWDEVVTHRPLEARTRARYEDLWRLHVEPAFGPVPVVKVSTGDVRTRSRTLLARGLSPATVAQCVTVLSLTMREAIEQGIRQDNPARGCRPKSSAPEPGRALTGLEVAAIVKAAGIDGPVFLLASVVGFRFGELAGLRVGDIDLERGRVSVQRTIIEIKGEQSVKPYPKGGSSGRRVVGIPKVVSERLRPNVEGRAANAWLWPNAAGGPMYYPVAAARLRRAMKAAGLVPAGLHILRRTAATLSLQSGTNLRDVQAMLGHSSPLMTMTRYAIPDVSAQTEGSARVAESIFPDGTRPKTGHSEPPAEQPNQTDEQEGP
jgi:integrase